MNRKAKFEEKKNVYSRRYYRINKLLNADLLNMALLPPIITVGAPTQPESEGCC